MSDGLRNDRGEAPRAFGGLGLAPVLGPVLLGPVLLVALGLLVGCGGSASETPPPIEPAQHPVMVDEDAAPASSTEASPAGRRPDVEGSAPVY